jgi:hypothetical protein
VVLGDGRTAEVATEALEGVTIVGVDVHGGVQLEAFEVGVARTVAWRRDVVMRARAHLQ